MPVVPDDGPASQGQLNAVAARLDARLDTVAASLKEDIKRLGMELLKYREESAKQADLKALQQDMQRLLAVVIDSAEKGKTYFDKALPHGHILQDHEVKLREHGRRLTAVETKPG